MVKVSELNWCSKFACSQVVVRNSAGVVQGTYPANRVALAQQQGQPGAQAGAGTTAAAPQGAEQATPQPTPPQPTTIQIQFYGHSPNIKGKNSN